MCFKNYNRPKNLREIWYNFFFKLCENAIDTFILNINEWCRRLPLIFFVTSSKVILKRRNMDSFNLTILKTQIHNEEEIIIARRKRKLRIFIFSFFKGGEEVQVHIQKWDNFFAPIRNLQIRWKVNTIASCRIANTAPSSNRISSAKPKRIFAIRLIYWMCFTYLI